MSSSTRRVPSGIAALFCALALLFGGTWVATVNIASAAVASEDDDAVNADAAAPGLVETTRVERRRLRPLVSRVRVPRRRRLRPVAVKRPSVARRLVCAPRRGPPALTAG